MFSGENEREDLICGSIILNVGRSSFLAIYRWSLPAYHTPLFQSCSAVSRKDMTLEREDKWKILNKNAMQPIRSAPAAITTGPVLLYTKVVGRTDTGSYPEPNPVPDLEILFVVNLNFQVRLTYCKCWPFVFFFDQLNQENYNIF